LKLKTQSTVLAGIHFCFRFFLLTVSLFFCSWAAKRFLTINYSKLALYMGCTFFGAMWYEIILDTLFVKFVGQPGWLYKIWLSTTDTPPAWVCLCGHCMDFLSFA